MKLYELLNTFNKKPQDVDLYHWDYDVDSATMVELSMNDFTTEGKEKFDEILHANVVMMKAMGENWVSVWVKDVVGIQVETLSYSHSGNCSVAEYKLWFTMEAREDANNDL